jgi:methionine synthase II (cobalamin-independent)
VGSLLRPAELKDARTRHQNGEIATAELKAIEDRAIEALVAKQAKVGLRSATNGEFRRGMWHFDFLERLEGCEPFTREHGIAFKGVTPKPRACKWSAGLVSAAIRCSITSASFAKLRFLREVTLPSRSYAARHAEDDDPLAKRSPFSRWP